MTQLNRFGMQRVRAHHIHNASEHDKMNMTDCTVCESETSGILLRFRNRLRNGQIGKDWNDINRLSRIIKR